MPRSESRAKTAVAAEDAVVEAAAAEVIEASATKAVAEAAKTQKTH